MEKQANGKVWIAGAGPGDAGLLTVKVRALLDRVDVIVYDALVSVEILSLIPPETELIYVGKRAGHHAVPQTEINEILLRQARQGKAVLRLKGGDPFVFGRGGEEVELLAEHGIPFEVVPGVTSAAAVPAYAGIPLTHRDFTSSFHVITGHPRKDGTSRIDYPALVKMKGTLVFLMGVTSLERIMEGLMQAGMEKDTPAAVLEKGTLAGQRRIVSTVSGLAEKASEAGIGMPAIIIVGKVCALAEEFHWAEDRCLGGRQILVTRPRRVSSSLADKLRFYGAQVIELPSIRTQMISPNPRLKEALEGLGKSGEEWLVFTSPAGVLDFFRQLREQKMDIRSIFGGSWQMKVGAIGSATARELESHGIQADVVPDVFCAKALGEGIAQAAQTGSHVTVVRAAEGSEELIPPLLAAGLTVDDVPLYETVYETHEQVREKIQDLFAAGAIDAVTFTSASTVKGFVQGVGLSDYRHVTAVCIGEQTAKEAARLGMRVLVSREASIDSMIQTVMEEFGCCGIHANG